MIARIFTTCMIVMVMGTVFGVGSNLVATHDVVAGAVAKHAFNFNIGLVGGWFVLGTVLIGRMHVHGNAHFTPLNLNIVLVGLAVFLLATSALLQLFDEGSRAIITGEGAGMLIGGAYNAILGGITGWAMALAKRDAPETD